MNCAIILAAGESRRMGQPKQLLTFAGKTMLECVVGAFRIAEVSETLVVLGYRAEEIAKTVHGAKTVLNPNYARGMFSSVQAGLRALPAQTKNVLLALADQPRLRSETVRRLIGDFESHRRQILVPSYNGRQGHPLLLAAQFVPEILAMEESLTLKHFLANHPDKLARLVVKDKGVLVDIDDHEAYERELKRQR